MATTARPKSLPSGSEMMPTSLHKEGVKTHVKLATSSAPVVISPDSVISSLKSMTCDQPSSPQETVPSLMVISPQNGALDLESLPQERGSKQKGSYKLTEVVSKEKEQLFQGAADYDLEPYQYLSTRRRSRNFYILSEEDEEDVPTDIEPKEDQNKAVMHVPMFHLGKSLRRLYYPFSKSSKKFQEVNEESEEGSTMSGYESEPDSYQKLYQKIVADPTIRRISSTPQLSSFDTYAESAEGADFSSFSKSRNLSTSNPQDVSRKLQKRPNKGISDSGAAEHKGPLGFSILSHLAGDLHIAQANKDTSVEETSDDDTCKTVVNRSKNAVERKDTSSLPKNSVNAQSGIGGGDSPSKRDSSCKPEKQSFMKSVISWGTTAKVTVTNQEANIYSPTSF